MSEQIKDAVKTNSGVIFWTNTSLDLRALTTMGLSAKPGTEDPIGKFGTGLKMAISVLLRNSATVRLYINGQMYWFGLKENDFRGTEYQQVMMYKKTITGRWFPTKLPYTLHLGSHWKIWMAFRELMSNTIDESGLVFKVKDAEAQDSPALARPTTTTTSSPREVELVATEVLDAIPEHYMREGTLWVIEHPHFDTLVDEYFTGESTVFLHIKDTKPLFENEAVTIWDRPSKHLYFKNVRVYTPRNPCMLTYNFKNRIDLTEDRTIGNIWDVQYYLSQIIRFQIHDEQVLKRLLSKKEDTYYEDGDLNFHYNSSEYARIDSPSDKLWAVPIDDGPFLRVAASVKQPTPGVIVVRSAQERSKKEAQKKRLEYHMSLQPYVKKALKSYVIDDMPKSELRHWEELLKQLNDGDDDVDDMIF